MFDKFSEGELHSVLNVFVRVEVKTCSVSVYVCVCVCTYACLRVGVWICVGCVKLKVKNTQHLFLITFLLKIPLTSHETICTIIDIT